MVFYTNGDGDAVPYDTCYTDDQRKKATVRCAYRHGSDSRPRVRTSEDHPPKA